MVGSSGRFITASSPVADVAQQLLRRHNGVRRGAWQYKKIRVQCNGLLWAWSSADKSMWARVAVVHRVDGRSRSRALDEAATAVLATAACPSHTSTTTNQGSRITLKIS